LFNRGTYYPPETAKLLLNGTINEPRVRQARAKEMIAIPGNTFAIGLLAIKNIREY
jgi:hypothetical protein